MFAETDAPDDAADARCPNQLFMASGSLGLEHRANKQLSKSGQWPEVTLLSDDIKPVTVLRCGRETNRFNRLCQTLRRGLSIAELTSASAWQALSILAVLLADRGR